MRDVSRCHVAAAVEKELIVWQLQMWLPTIVILWRFQSLDTCLELFATVAKAVVRGQSLRWLSWAFCCKWGNYFGGALISYVENWFVLKHVHFCWHIRSFMADHERLRTVNTIHFHLSYVTTRRTYLVLCIDIQSRTMTLPTIDFQTIILGKNGTINYFYLHSNLLPYSSACIWCRSMK